MRFLRLSTNCAVFDDEGRVLLSKRGDLNVWNLPGGRLDSGELCANAAAREVREETGMIAHVERAVGLYYWQGWDRLNILYAGFPVGGDLVQQTDETRENRFFALSELPQLKDREMIDHAVSPQRPVPQILSSPLGELRRVRWALRRRYVSNMLHSKPEPRHVRFNIHAVGIIWEKHGQRVLTLPNQQLRSLPRIVCDGRVPWEQLALSVRRYTDAALNFHWVGVWQYLETDMLEFIFAATIREHAVMNGAEWSTAHNGILNDRETEYMTHTPPDYAAKPVWTLTAVDDRPANTIML